MDEDDWSQTLVGDDFKAALVTGQSPYLMVLQGTCSEVTFELETRALVIGRSDEADVVLHDDRVSRRHARIWCEDDTVFIEDLGSSNGTFIDTRPLTGKAALADGAKIQIATACVLKLAYQDALEADFQRKMLDQALRDSLTGAYNRRFLLDRLESEFRYARRHEAPLSLVMMDIDRFKAVNDTHGHLAGDRILAAVSSTVQRTIRAEDVLGRFGGEEFVLICRGCDAASAEIAAERIRRQVAAAEVSIDKEASSVTVSVTISLGIASFPEITADAEDQLIAAADAALYDAKEAGRNCIRIARGSRRERTTEPEGFSDL